MPNPTANFGLRACLVAGMGQFEKAREFDKDAAATVIYEGDVVSQEADSNIAPGGTPGTTNYKGVSLNWGAAGILTKHLVITDPAATFLARASTGTLVIADRGSYSNFAFGAGNTFAPRISGHSLAAASKATTTTLDAFLIQFWKDTRNEEGANAVFEIKINRRQP
jgi:hypothetical protein